MHVGDAVMYSHVDHTMKTSDDERMNEMYENVWLHLGGKPKSVQALFMQLLPAMKRLENGARTKRDLMHVKNDDVHEDKIEDESEDSMSAMREHTMNMTDVQVQVCARTLMDARELKEGDGGEGIT